MSRATKYRVFTLDDWALGATRLCEEFSFVMWALLVELVGFSVVLWFIT